MVAREPVAQPVEHLTFNQGVKGSNPFGLTNNSKRRKRPALDSYLGQTTASILHTTADGPGTQFMEVCVTLPPSLLAFCLRSS